MNGQTRRDFLKCSTGAAFAMQLNATSSFASLTTDTFRSSGAASPTLAVKKGLVLSMLPAKMTYAERFKLARDVGFEVIQAPTTPNQSEADEIQRAASASGILIDSVMNMDHWDYPLSSSDPAVVEKSMKGMRTSLHNAKLWRSDAVLLVPAVVNAGTSYRDAWTRSRKQIRELLPLAEELKIVITIEEVWNKFLLSPLEFARYVDDFQSPWIRAYFDVGNVAITGYPQDWIRILGKRIVKLHVKDFSFKKRVAEFTPLLEGEIDFKAVHAALAEIGYQGTATVELNGGDGPYLKEVNARFEKILAG
jgi:L-ribulose-5-phosphate 3-epimerase